MLYGLPLGINLIAKVNYKTKGEIMKYQIKLMGLDGIYEASNFGDDRYTIFDTEKEAREVAEREIALFIEADRGHDCDEEIVYDYVVDEIEDEGETVICRIRVDRTNYDLYKPSNQEV
jgi:hypothetical protein